MHYYKHHIGDFDRATRHLTRLERSIYRDLIELYYDTEQPLTLDRAALCRRIIARSNEEETAVEQVLNEFFNETPSGWYHGRCEEEIAAYRVCNSQKSVAGKASAAARAEKKQQAINGSSTSVATSVEQTNNGAPTNQEPVTNNQEPDISAAPVSAAPKKVRDKVTLEEFIQNEKEQDRKFFHEDLRAWMTKTETPEDILGVHWYWFRNEFAAGRKYKDWRATFRKSVLEVWGKLFAIDSNGTYYLTTAGKQIQAMKDKDQ